MEIIAVSNYKGGVGKTTTAINVAYNMAIKGKRVLLVDADPQGNASYMVWKYSPTVKTLAYMYAEGKMINSVIRRSRFKNLDVVPATASLESLNKTRTDTRKLLTELHEVKDRYDYCIIDCQPTMQFLTKSALVAADLVLVPFKADGFSISGLELMNEFFQEAEEESENVFKEKMEYKCVVTMFRNNRKNLDKIIKLIETSDYPVADSVISYAEACNTSIDARKPLLMHRAKNKVTVDYMELTEEIIRHFGDTAEVREEGEE